MVNVLKCNEKDALSFIKGSSYYSNYYIVRKFLRISLYLMIEAKNHQNRQVDVKTSIYLSYYLC